MKSPPGAPRAIVTALSSFIDGKAAAAAAKSESRAASVGATPDSLTTCESQSMPSVNGLAMGGLMSAAPSRTPNGSAFSASIAWSYCAPLEASPVTDNTPSVRVADPGDSRPTACSASVAALTSASGAPRAYCILSLTARPPSAAAASRIAARAPGFGASPEIDSALSWRSARQT